MRPKSTPVIIICASEFKIAVFFLFLKFILQSEDDVKLTQAYQSLVIYTLLRIDLRATYMLGACTSLRVGRMLD